MGRRKCKIRFPKKDQQVQLVRRAAGPYWFTAMGIASADTREVRGRLEEIGGSTMIPGRMLVRPPRWMIRFESVSLLTTPFRLRIYTKTNYSTLLDEVDNLSFLAPLTAKNAENAVARTTGKEQVAPMPAPAGGGAKDVVAVTISYPGARTTVPADFCAYGTSDDLNVQFISGELELDGFFFTGQTILSGPDWIVAFSDIPEGEGYTLTVYSEMSSDIHTEITVRD